MKRLVMTIALACVLSSSALAGEMPTGGYAPPDPNDTTLTTAPGDIPNVDNTGPTETDITLTVLQTLLSFLSI